MDGDGYSERIDVVQLDGSVILRIIKHARDGEESVVPTQGLLLGLPRDNTLEVTSCFTFKGDEQEEEKLFRYQEDMQKAMRNVRLDVNITGWFIVTPLDKFFNKEIINDTFKHQTENKSSVCLVMEPYRLGSGRLNIKAYRLTEAYMALHGAEDFSQTAFARHGVAADEIFEEVRVQVHNSHLVHAFLYELRESKVLSGESARLAINVNGYVEQSLEVMGNAIGDYLSQLQGEHYYHRQLGRQKTAQQNWINKRAAENDVRAKQGNPLLADDRMKHSIFKPLPKPARLDTFLITNRLSHLSKQALSDTTQGFSKMYIVDALHR